MHWSTPRWIIFSFKDLFKSVLICSKIKSMQGQNSKSFLVNSPLPDSRGTPLPILPIDAFGVSSLPFKNAPGQKPIIVALSVGSRFSICCFLSKPERLKCDRG